jgi:tRNA-dihydrouridine synthase 1
VESLVSAMANSLTIPVSAKLRLCNPSSLTPDLAERISLAKASFVTLHARTVSARRRRAGPADLSAVKAVKQRLTRNPSLASVRVISNGNVRVFEDLEENISETGADGLMVGEALLGNPRFFEGVIPDPIEISLEYLAQCEAFADVVTIKVIHNHIRHIIDSQWGRKPWFKTFRTRLGKTETIEEVRHLLSVKVAYWRGVLHSTSLENDNTDCA